MCVAAAASTPLLQTARLSGLVSRYRGSVLLEVQSRCCEYSRLLDSHAPLTPQLLERMPAIESPDLTSSGGATPSASTGGAAAAGAALAAAAPAAAAAAAGDDLVDLLGGLDAAAAAVGRVSGSGLNSGPSSLAGGSAAAAAAVPALGGLDDLLGPVPAAGAASSVAAPDIFGMLGEPQPTAAAAAGAPVGTGLQEWGFVSLLNVVVAVEQSGFIISISSSSNCVSFTSCTC